MTLDGKPVECECGGLLGRCIQHELDHLDGKLFVDRVEPVELGKVERELRQRSVTGRSIISIGSR